MRHTLAGLLLWLALAAPAAARVSAYLPNGVTVEFETRLSDGAGVEAAGGVWMRAADSFYRLLHASGRLLFGYEVQVHRTVGSPQVHIRIVPLDDRFRNEDDRGAPWLRLYRENPSLPLPTFAAARELPPLRSGDIVRLEIMRHPATGVVLLDELRVLLDREPEPVPEVPLTPLRLLDVRIFRDGELMTRGALSAAGAVVAFRLADGERIHISASRPTGRPYRHIGLVDGNRLTFVWDNRRYEISSSARILRSGVQGQVWIRVEEPAAQR